MFGVEAPDFSPEACELLKPAREPTGMQNAQQLQQALAQARKIARKASKQAQAQHKRAYDRRVAVPEYAKGDFAMCGPCFPHVMPHERLQQW